MADGTQMPGFDRVLFIAQVFIEHASVKALLELGEELAVKAWDDFLRRAASQQIPDVLPGPITQVVFELDDAAMA